MSFCRTAIFFIAFAPAAFAGASFCAAPIYPPPGALAAGASQAPYSAISAKPSLTKDQRSKLASLCWRIDDKTGRVLGPGGAVLTQGQMSAFLAAYDTDKNPIGPDEKSDLYSEDRCRFEPDRVLCRDEHGKISALTYLDEASFRQQDMLQKSQDLVERVAAFLATQPPGRPLSAAARDEISRMSLNITGKKSLPPALAGMISLRASLPAGELRGDFLRADRDLTRFFDGQESFKDFLAANNFPAVRTGEWNAKASQSYFNSTEAKLGALCAAKTQAVLLQNPVGAELMKRFEDKGGEIRLPAFLVGNLGDFDAAAYFPGNDTVIFNRKYILDDPAFNALSNAQKRTLHQDSNKMNAWLLAHPAVFNRFIRNNDFVIAHELTHAALDREVPTGPYTPGDILENEHEAYTTQMRYMMAQILAHPRASLANSNYQDWMPQLQSMLANYNQFLQGIDQQYLSGDSVEAADIPTAEEIVRREKSGSLALGLKSLPLLGKELVKIMGLDETSDALGRFQRDYQARTRKFLSGSYKTMQSEAKSRFPIIAAQALARSRKESSDAALNDLAGAKALAESANILGAKDSRIIAQVQQAALGRARARLFDLRRAKSIEDRYSDIYAAYAFAAIPQDGQAIVQAEEAADDFISEALAGAKSGKGARRAVVLNLRLADSLAQEIYDSAASDKIEAVLKKLNAQGEMDAEN